MKTRMRSHLGACGLALALLSPCASIAQPAAKPAEAEGAALTDKARQLYEEGLAALRASRWAEAHAALLAAWRIKPHWQIASNLAVAELRLGKHRDAAEHLAWYLREAPATRAETRARAEAMLKEASAKVAAITVEGAPEGAKVLVDGAVVGEAPLAQPVFLNPGEHEIEAQLEGYAPAKQRVVAEAGKAGTIALAMEREAEPKPPEAAGPVRDTGKAAVPPLSPPPGRSWVPVIALGAGSVVALGVGVGLTVASNGASDDAHAGSAAIIEQGRQCVKPSVEWANACDQIRDDASRGDAFANAARIAYIASGALAISAAAVALWPRPKTAARLHAVPLVQVGSVGIHVEGVW